MAKTELFYIGTDFTPLEKQVPNGKQYGFCFECNKGSEKSKTFAIDNQTAILQKFLIEAQKNIDKLIVDPTLSNEEKRLYDYHNQQMFFGGLVGAVSIKNFVFDERYTYDITLQINTRLDFKYEDGPELFEVSEHEDVNHKKAKPFFLMTLLFNDYKPLSNSTVNQDKEGLTDMLLLYSFIEKYKEAFTKGYFKTYHRFEYNNERLKGSINIAEHIRSNMGLSNGKVAYSFKEKSENNYINHLVLTAYEHLKKKYYEQTISAFGNVLNLRNSLEALKPLIAFPAYPERTLVSKSLNPISHPYYTEYEDLRKVCLKILRDEKISIFSGKDEDQVSGVLMYVPRLWEKYIEHYLYNNEYKAQDLIRVLDVNNNKEYVQATMPDFVFYSDEKPFMILDAKFKPGWLQAATKGFMGELLLSDYDKCIRDMVSIHANASAVIFPTNTSLTVNSDSFVIDGVSYRYVHNISKFNTQDRFYTFPVPVPEATDNYQTWKEKFDRSVTDCLKYVINLIREEKKLVV